MTEVTSLKAWEAAVPELLSGDGCRFVRVEVTSTYDRERVAALLTDPAALVRHTGTGYWRLHAAIAAD